MFSALTSYSSDDSDDKKMLLGISGETRLSPQVAYSLMAVRRKVRSLTLILDLIPN